MWCRKKLCFALEIRRAWFWITVYFWSAYCRILWGKYVPTWRNGNNFWSTAISFILWVIMFSDGLLFQRPHNVECGCHERFVCRTVNPYHFRDRSGPLEAPEICRPRQSQACLGNIFSSLLRSRGSASHVFGTYGARGKNQRVILTGTPKIIIQFSSTTCLGFFTTATSNPNSSVVS